MACAKRPALRDAIKRNFLATKWPDFYTKKFTFSNLPSSVVVLELSAQ